MTSYRTRFRPSLNGPLHLGSLYVAWQNSMMAHSRGGEFIVIADCTVPEAKTGAPVDDDLARELLAGWEADLTWMGLAPDLVVRSDDPVLRAKHAEAAQKLNITPNDGKRAPAINRSIFDGSDSRMPPYDPWLTVGRVSDDHELGVSGFTRGGDLLGEQQLYDYMAWQLYGFSYRVQQTYVCTIVDDGGKLSKSDGAPSILDYRQAGYKPAEIIEAFKHLEYAVFNYGLLAQRYCEVPLRAPS